MIFHPKAFILLLGTRTLSCCMATLLPSHMRKIKVIHKTIQCPFSFTLFHCPQGQLHGAEVPHRGLLTEFKGQGGSFLTGRSGQVKINIIPLGVACLPAITWRYCPQNFYPQSNQASRFLLLSVAVTGQPCVVPGSWKCSGSQSQCARSIKHIPTFGDLLLRK